MYIDCRGFYLALCHLHSAHELSSKRCDASIAWPATLAILLIHTALVATTAWITCRRTHGHSVTWSFGNSDTLKQNWQVRSSNLCGPASNACAMKVFGSCLVGSTPAFRDCASVFPRDTSRHRAGQRCLDYCWLSTTPYLC